MADKKKDPGGVGLQIEAPSPVPDKALCDVDIALNLPRPLSLDEKKYLLAVERGDLANVRRILQKAFRNHDLNVNCVDSLGRGSLTLAIDGENFEMLELLVVMGVETKDALLQAINAEFVEAVELLLEHEELIHKEGELYSWQKVDLNTAMFAPEITPLILAAHKNNYEIIKILLDRGATLPQPHDIRCPCEECIKRSSEDSLRHSLSRVNEYRALASPSLIALSSSDPLQTAFQLSWELRNLAFAEQECKTEYLELRRQCQQFAVDLLDQTRSSQELAIILNYDPESPPYQDGDHMKLKRLEMAIDFKQKKFVAHPNIQQLLASLWYEGVPGFRRKSPSEKIFIISKVAILFPLYCMLYMFAPYCHTAKLMRKPFMKFLIHASSYLFFLFILILVSQRAEVQAVLLFGTESMKKAMQEELLRQRGNLPTPLEMLVVVYVLGFIWEETQEIYIEGIRSYLRNMWNFIDFSRNSLYCLVFLLRIIAYIQQCQEIARDSNSAFIAREHWDDFDPQLIADGLFAAANIFSALKLVHLFSINPHLGPLQISLGRMVIDIVKFFFIYTLVLFAFACGLNQLLWYYADLEKAKCYSLPGGLPDWDREGDACMKWRRFGNLFESSQSLFWASFGMVGLENFELLGIKSYTRFWGLLMFGSYSVINVIVLLNLLIAMMSNSYAMIEQHSDTEWKFARTKLWMSYFDESATLPPPFNILPNIKHFTKCCRKSKSQRELKRESTIRRKEEKERANRYTNVMRSLVWRYVSTMHRKMEESAVTEDDINEVKGEISAMRYEMLEVFERNGMDVSSADKKEKTVLAKRMKVWERRLMKDFHVAPVEIEHDPDEVTQIEENPLDRFRRISRQVASQSASAKWGQVIQSVTLEANSQIGRCRNRESFKNQQNLLKAMEQARKLIERSPLPTSRNHSPIHFMDETNNTLVQLLHNISEEINELSPQNTLNVRDRSRVGSTTPLQNLNAQLQTVLSKSPTARRGVSPARDSKTPASMISAKTPTGILSPPKTPITPKTSPTPKTPRSPSPTDCSKSFDEKLTSNTSTKPKITSPPPISSKSPTPPPKHCTVQSPPPIIQVTRTESQLRKSDSKDSLKEKPQSPKLIDFSDKSESKEQNKDEENQVALTQGPGSPVKVVKRKAPIPTSVPSSSSAEIAVSRPIASKPQPGQGMIPPPPEVAPKIIPILSTTPATPLLTQKCLTEGSKVEKSKAPDTPAPISEIPCSIQENIQSTSVITADAVTSDSTEQLISTKDPSSDAIKAATSPPCLRPVRKIEDVKTVKRQPKSGWL